MKIVKESLNKLFKSNDSITIDYVEKVLLVKFSKRKYAKDIDKGNIHLCALKYYRGKEN